MGKLQVNGDISATGRISASSFLGNASSASKWATARTIKIGKTGKSVDGSSNVSWTHYEIGVPYCYDTSPTGSPAYSHWGMLISREENKYGQSGTGDNYFIGVNSNSQLHIGHQLNGTSVITWTNILSEHNYSSYALPLSGGTMSGSPVIKFPASAGSIAASDPMAITYGRISAYGTLCINADSDGSTDEYLILTSGRGLSGSTADGLAIGYNTLTWQNNTIIHSSNYTSYTVTKTGGGASGTWGINVTGQATYVRDSYNGSNITITYGKSGQSSTSWLASWNGYELGAIAPSSITAGWASGASYSNSSNALASTGWGNGNFTYLQTSGDFYGNSGWSHYLISNHGNGETYYNYVIALPFWDSPRYQRMSGGNAGGWHRFHTTENVIIQNSTPEAGFYGQIWFKI